MTFEEFAARHGPSMRRFAAVLAGDVSSGDDIVQEVLVRAHARWRRISSLDRPEFYVRKMVLNEFTSARRRLWRTVPGGRGSDIDQRITPDHATSVADRDALLEELRKLPRQQRAVMVLRYFEGFSDPEIAQFLGVTPVTVRGYATRALAALRVGWNHEPSQDNWQQANIERSFQC
ncbi:MAG TPA: SigE family RNA polymerase sigma factor [Streptosporangiaceae bacterium]|nr:SigE family RNA polymerase sigma factor [Streptosporangiaceae bacterium]